MAGDELYSPSEANVWKGWGSALTEGVKNLARFLPRGEEGAPYGGLTETERATANYPPQTTPVAAPTPGGPHTMGPLEEAPAPPVPALEGKPVPATTGPASTAALLTPEQNNRAALREAGSMGLLPWDYFNTHPEFAGGVMKVGDVTQSPDDMRRKLEGAGIDTSSLKGQDLINTYQAYSQHPGNTGFDISGKLYSLLEPAGKPGIQGKAEEFLNDFMGRAKALITSNQQEAVRLGTSMAGQIPGMMGEQNRAALVPSEVARNMRTATEPIFNQHYAGEPGSMETTMWTPGGGVSRIAQGASEYKAMYGMDMQKMRTLQQLNTEADTVLNNPLSTPEMKAAAQKQKIYSLENLSTMLSQGHQHRDAYENFAKQVRAKYPQATEQQIQDAFNTKMLAAQSQGQ